MSAKFILNESSLYSKSKWSIITVEFCFAKPSVLKTLDSDTCDSSKS